MRERLIRIAWRFVPTPEQLWTVSIRAGIGGALWIIAHLDPRLAWAGFLAKLFAMMALWALLGVWERQVVDHARRACQLAWSVVKPPR